MKLIGYARFSTGEPDLSLRLAVAPPLFCGQIILGTWEKTERPSRLFESVVTGGGIPYWQETQEAAYVGL